MTKTSPRHPKQSKRPISHPSASVEAPKPTEPANDNSFFRNVGLLSSEEFCAITLLTDRRLRQIADRKYYPPPIESKWQLLATLAGFIRYQRELDDTEREVKQKIEDEKHRKLKLANDEKDGLLTDTQKLAESVLPMFAAIKELTYQRLVDEIPIAMAGVDVPQARILGRRYADELILKWKSAVEKLKV